MSNFGKTPAGSDDFPGFGIPGEVPDFLINQGLPEPPSDDNGLLSDLHVLIAQHPGGFNFRAPDLAKMDDKAKRQLLIDMQEALGIRPLNRIHS